MKKLPVTLGLILLPLSVLAYTGPWSYNSTTTPVFYPAKTSGVYPPITVPYITASSTTGTSTFAGIINTDTAYYLLGYPFAYFNAPAQSTFFGLLAGNSTMTGIRNYGMGNYALRFNTTGSNNTGVGDFSMSSNTTGSQNVAIGASAQSSAFSGSDNTAIGYNTLYSNANKSGNTAIGSEALYSNTSGASTTAIGYQAGYNNGSGFFGDGNVFIGYRAGYNEYGDNKLYISNSDTNTPLIKGDFSAKTLTFSGTTTSPCFTNDGTTCITGGSPAAPINSIQFNNNYGGFGGDGDLTWGTQTLGIGQANSTSKAIINQQTVHVSNLNDDGSGSVPNAGAFLTSSVTYDVYAYKDVGLERIFSDSWNSTYTSTSIPFEVVLNWLPQSTDYQGFLVQSSNGYYIDVGTMMSVTDDGSYSSGDGWVAGTADISHTSPYQFVNDNGNALQVNSQGTTSGLTIDNSDGLGTNSVTLKAEDFLGTQYMMVTPNHNGTPTMGQRGGLYLVGYGLQPDPTLLFVDGAGTFNQNFSMANLTGQLNLVDGSGNTQMLWTQGDALGNSGRVIIGIDDYIDDGAAKLQVYGGIKSAIDYTSISSSTEGQMSWDYTNHHSMIYDGTEWRALATGVSSYGSFYNDGVFQAQTIGVAGVWYQVDGGFMVGSSSPDITFQNDKELKVTVPGEYKVDWHMSLRTSGGPIYLGGAVMVNGVEQTNTTSYTYLPDSSDERVVSGSSMINFSANDLVSLSVMNKSDTSDISITGGTLTLRKM